MSEPPNPELQLRWNIPDKICIRTAVSGRSAREAKGDVSSFALDLESYARQAVEVIEAGAIGVHLDVGGITTTRGQKRRPSAQPHYEKLVSLISEKTNRDWSPCVNILHGENFKENMLPITSGLGETCVMAPANDEDWMEAVARVVTDHGKRVMFAIHGVADVALTERRILRKGILQKPYMWGILIGYDFDEVSQYQTSYIPNPRAMIQELTMVIDRIHEIDENAWIEVSGAGRSAQYIYTLAILMGLHVRTGTEDTVWRYPHKDERLSGGSDNYIRTRTIAEQLGRKSATVEEFRDMLQIKK